MNRLYDPFYYCNKRTPTCHGACKQYKLSCELKAKDKKQRDKDMLERDVTSGNWNYDKRGRER